MVILSSGFGCRRSEPTKAAESPAGVTEGAPRNARSADQKAEEWTCPMHPQVREKAPGRCPICGMTLVKVNDGTGHEAEGTASRPDGHAAFELSEGRQQLIGVKTGTVTRKPLFKDIEAAGRLAFDPELYTAQTEYSEALQELQRVRDSPLPDVKRSAERMIQSAKLRLKILGLSDRQIAHIGAGQEGESNLLITRPGQNVWIYADIFEMDLPYVQSGQSAEITAGFLKGRTLAGKVVSVDRVINAATRTAKARILVPEGSAYLRPESYVDVTIHAPLGEQVSVPFDAVLDTGRQAWVFLVSDGHRFTPRLVQVKFHAGSEVAIASGLNGGEKIVTSANFLIDSESRMRSAAQSDEVSEPATSGESAPRRKSLPSCPGDQHWDVPMAMCMPN